MSANLVHNYEMLDKAQGSLAAAPRTAIASSYIYLDPSWFDGASYYLEVVYKNTLTSNYADGIALVDHSDGDAVLATLTPVASTTVSTRLRSAPFIPTWGKHVYALSLPQTSVNSEVTVATCRIVIVQKVATKTRLQIPLLTDNFSATAITNTFAIRHNSGDYTAEDKRCSWFTKQSSDFAALFGDTPWTLEAVLSSDNATRYGKVQLYNETDGTEVAASEVVQASPGLTVQIAEKSFANNATNWSDGDVMALRVRSSQGSYYGMCYRAALYVTLNPLSQGEAWLRCGVLQDNTTGQTVAQWSRAKCETSSYSTPAFYFDISGLCLDATTAAARISTFSTNDSGTIGAVDLDTHIWNSGSKAHYRSGKLSSVTNGYRIMGRPATTTNAQTASGGFLVVAFGSLVPFVDQIEGLIQGQVYHVRAYAVNADGISYGEVVDFYTRRGRGFRLTYGKEPIPTGVTL